MNHINRIMVNTRISQTIGVILFAAFLAVLTAARALAQSKEDAVPQTELSHVMPLQASSQHRAAANNGSNFRYHLLPAKTDAARGVPLNGPERLSPFVIPESKSAIPLLPRSGLTSPRSSPKFFPADLSYFGGAVVRSAVHDNVYFICTSETCWGNPVEFLTDLGKSKFVHLVDQYVGSKANNRYTMGAQLTASARFCSSPTFCSADDILGIAHAAAVVLGGDTGYRHIIHIFLPSRVDTCMDVDNTVCYSPDNPPTFAFCAYHSSFVFNDIGKVLYTVEPYQFVEGCDSTNSALSHEVFETITDPDGDAWVAANTNNLDGFEIADLCAGPIDGNFLIGTSGYQVQLEYSNKYHACASAP
jgi:hypothetical protein